MLLLGGFTLHLFDLVGGTDREVQYLAYGSVLGAALIAILLALQVRDGNRRKYLPRMHPAVALFGLAFLFYLLMF